jgi:hypothetical protein
MASLAQMSMQANLGGMAGGMAGAGFGPAPQGNPMDQLRARIQQFMKMRDMMEQERTRQAVNFLRQRGVGQLTEQEVERAKEFLKLKYQKAVRGGATGGMMGALGGQAVQRGKQMAPWQESMNQPRNLPFQPKGTESFQDTVRRVRPQMPQRNLGQTLGQFIGQGQPARQPARQPVPQPSMPRVQTSPPSMPTYTPQYQFVPRQQRMGFPQRLMGR